MAGAGTTELQSETARDTSERARWQRFLLYLAAIGALLLIRGNAFPLDDAYIALHNAHALIAGGDPVYGSSPLTGATSLVHLALLALLGLAIPLTVASLLINIVATLLYAAGLDSLMRKHGATGSLVPLLVITGLFGGATTIHLFNGLETSMAAATVTWLLVFADDKRLPWLAGLAPFVRPELALLAGLLLIREYARSSLGEKGTAIVLVVLIALPWLLWEFMATGSLLPNTAQAKALFFSNWDWSIYLRLRVLVIIFARSGYLVLLVGLIGVGWYRSLFVVGMLAVALATTPDALGWNEERYLAPLVPIMLAGLAQLSTDPRRSKLVTAVCGVVLLFAPLSITTMRHNQAGVAQDLAEIPKALALVPSRSKVLIHDAGVPAWTQSRLVLVDATGLKTPSSMAWHRAFTRHGCDLGTAVDGIARSSNAEFALILSSYPWSCIGNGLRQRGWTLQPLFTTTTTRYTLYRLAPPKKSGSP